MAVVAAACAAIGLVGLTMYRLSYDVWAGVVLAPVLVVGMIPVFRRLLGADLDQLLPFVIAGFLVKLVGSCARYYVVFDAYGKNADAERYFDAGNELAAAVRAGRQSLFSVLPFARDAEFVERLAGAVLVVLGPTRLGGFFLFSTFAYVGTVCCIRAAAMAIPGLDARRYALCCVLAPSLAFWPSSLGKEAWIIGCVGFFSLGFAKILTWNGRSGGLALAAGASVAMGAVRPHLAAIFVGAATVGFVFSVMLPAGPHGEHRRRSLLGFAIVAIVGLALTSTAAVRYLDQGEEDQGFFGGIGSILERTSGQTEQGGSAFTPIDIDSPLRWPYAVVRTLTRPLLLEARSVATMLPALETTLFLALLVLGARRTRSIPTVLRRSPYLMYVVFATFMFGLAFSAVGNLGILVRQRSIVVPFLLTFLAMPLHARTQVNARTAPATLVR